MIIKINYRKANGHIFEEYADIKNKRLIGVIKGALREGVGKVEIFKSSIDEIKETFEAIGYEDGIADDPGQDPETIPNASGTVDT